MINFAINLRQKIGHMLNELAKVRQPEGFRGPLDAKTSILVLMLMESADDQTALTQLKKRLKELCPKASQKYLCFYQKTEEGDNFISNSEVEFFTEDDFNPLFKFKSQRLKEFLSATYDIGIVLTVADNLFVDYTAHYMRCSLRIGGRQSQLFADGTLNFIVGPSDALPLKPAVIGKNATDALALMFKGKGL